MEGDPYEIKSSALKDEQYDFETQNRHRIRYHPQTLDTEIGGIMATLQELLQQQAAIEREIELRRNTERNTAIAKIRELMAQHGLTADDFSTKAAKPSASAGTKVAAKYRNAATGDSWSGRGLQPKWLKAEIEQGKSLSDFLV